MEFKIPSLWKDEKILLPQMLSDLYIKKLKDIGMYEHAKNYVRNDAKEGAVGGISPEETNEHFAERFSNSCVRLQKVIIDPKCDFGKVPNYFFSTFAEGNIALLDSPCGTGAGALSLLYVLRELRLTKNLPILPLNITILACDYSDTALDVYKELLSIAESDFTQVGIKVNIKQTKWDAYCIKSTQLLMDAFKEISADEYFVLVSAFSGVTKEQLEKLKHSFQHMQGCLSVVPFTLVHVEPNTKKGKLLFNVLRSILEFFTSDRKIEEHQLKARFIWVDPTSKRDIKSNVMVSLNCRGI